MLYEILTIQKSDRKACMFAYVKVIKLISREPRALQGLGESGWRGFERMVSGYRSSFGKEE